MKAVPLKAVPLKAAHPKAVYRLVGHHLRSEQGQQPGCVLDARPVRPAPKDHPFEGGSRAPGRTGARGHLKPRVAATRSRC